LPLKFRAVQGPPWRSENFALSTMLFIIVCLGFKALEMRLSRNAENVEKKGMKKNGQKPENVEKR